MRNYANQLGIWLLLSVAAWGQTTVLPKTAVLPKATVLASTPVSGPVLTNLQAWYKADVGNNCSGSPMRQHEPDDHLGGSVRKRQQRQFLRQF